MSSLSRLTWEVALFDGCIVLLSDNMVPHSAQLTLHGEDKRATVSLHFSMHSHSCQLTGHLPAESSSAMQQVGAKKACRQGRAPAWRERAGLSPGHLSEYPYNTPLAADPSECESAPSAFASPASAACGEIQLAAIPHPAAVVGGRRAHVLHERRLREVELEVDFGPLLRRVSSEPLQSQLDAPSVGREHQVMSCSRSARRKSLGQREVDAPPSRRSGWPARCLGWPPSRRRWTR